MFTPDDHTQPAYEILLYIALIFIGLIALLFTLSVIKKLQLYMQDHMTNSNC